MAAAEDRAEARASLFAALQTGVTAGQTFEKHLPANPSGTSPIITVESDGALTTEEPAEYNNFRFVIGAFVERSDPATAEDVSDLLQMQIAQTVKLWHNAKFWRWSTMDYLKGDNYPGQWRVEWFYVEVDWTASD